MKRCMLLVSNILILTSTFAAPRKKPMTAPAISTQQRRSNQLPQQNIHEIKTQQEFEQILQQKEPTVIYTYTTSCGACKMMDSDYTQAAKKYGMRVKFYQANLETKELAPLIKKHNIKGIPTTFLRKQGSEHRRERGAITGQELDNILYRFAYGNEAANKRLLAQQRATAKKKTHQKK